MFKPILRFGPIEGGEDIMFTIDSWTRQLLCPLSPMSPLVLSGPGMEVLVTDTLSRSSFVLMLLTYSIKSITVNRAYLTFPH